MVLILAQAPRNYISQIIALINMQLLIIALIFLTACNLFAVYHISKKIDKIAYLQGHHNLHLVRLVYHKAIDIEDYEAVAKIKKSMPKDFDYYTFF